MEVVSLKMRKLGSKGGRELAFFTSEELGLRAAKILRFMLDKLGILKLVECINVP